MTAAERRKLTDVARGARPADVVIRGGTLLNVYTGELYPAHVAVKGERIAYVGGREDMVGARTTVLDATGRILVPGYIDPHVHPAHVTTPSALARFVLPRGTTSVFADTLQFMKLGGVRAFLRARGARARAARNRGDAARVIAPAGLERAARRAQGGPGARLAPDAHVRRLDAGVPARPWLCGSPAPRGPRAWRGAGRRLPHGDAEPGDLLRPRRRPRRDRARPVRRRLPARRPRRAAAGRRRRARPARRFRRPPPRARGRARVVARDRKSVV